MGVFESCDGVEGVFLNGMILWQMQESASAISISLIRWNRGQWVSELIIFCSIMLLGSLKS